MGRTVLIHQSSCTAKLHSVKSLTMPLDETNNESYRYLRSVGNPWQFDVEDLHPKMIARLYKRFDTFDLDCDGKMEMDEILYWPDRMRQLVNATDEQVER